MDGLSELFGGPLEKDPALALQAPPVPVDRPGPMHRIEFVIEFMGPRSVAAAAASALLQPAWYAALGEPKLWAMRPSDDDWQPLASGSDGSYDSIAACWPLLSERGKLTAAGCSSLVRAAEQFASHIQRRAMPLDNPGEIDRRVAVLEQTRDALDIGLSIAVVNPRGMQEHAIWRVCAALGLTFGQGGSFDWRPEGSLAPLLSVTPLESAGFSLGSVRQGTTHVGVGIGFSIPRSYSPSDSHRACFQIAHLMAGRLGGILVDENLDPMGASAEGVLRQGLEAALAAFDQVDIQPGSPEALAIWNHGQP